MRSRSSVLFIAALAALAAGSARLGAQSDGPPPSPRFARGPQDGIGFVGFEAGLGNRVVTGQPYCAKELIEHTQTLADGNQIDQKSTMTLCRDGQGRTRREQTLATIGPYTASGDPPQAVFISDPVAGVAYVLDPMHKTARMLTMPSRRTGPHNTLQFQRGNPDPNTTTTSLGSKTMEGILVQGTQFTRTIPAGGIGNAQAIQVVNTRWYSSDLDLNVRTETSDPSRGHTVTNLTNITRSEPDAALFQVPSDYTLQTVDAGGRRPRPGPRRGTAPPPQ